MPDPGGLSPAVEPMRKAAEQADDGAMEDRFVSFFGGLPFRRGVSGERMLREEGPRRRRRDQRPRAEGQAEPVRGGGHGQARAKNRRPGRRDRGPLRPGDAVLGIRRCLSARSGVGVSGKPVLAVAKGSCGEAERLGSRKLPECPFESPDGTRLPARRRCGDGPGRCERECAMAALGITGSLRKEALGFRLGPSESAEGREKRLGSLKERGVGNPPMFVADGPRGMPEAIGQAFPGSSRQRRMGRVGRKMSSGARRKDGQAILGDFESACSAES